MVQMSVIEARLSQLEVRISSLFRPEIHELQKILMDEEELVCVVPGRYFGGFALLAATDRRLILIDKKLAVLVTEIIPYDMISEVDFGARMLDATVTIFTVNKQHRFTCFKHKLKLRELTNYIQRRVMELRYGANTLVPAAVAQQTMPVQQAPLPLSEPLSAIPVAQLQYSPVEEIAPLAQATRSFHHMPKIVGAAAIHHAHFPSANPYITGSLTVKRQAYGSSGSQ